MSTYKRHRFLPAVISYAVLLYYRFNLSHRDIEDLLAERGIMVTRELLLIIFVILGKVRSQNGIERQFDLEAETLHVSQS